MSSSLQIVQLAEPVKQITNGAIGSERLIEQISPTADSSYEDWINNSEINGAEMQTAENIILLHFNRHTPGLVNRLAELLAMKITDERSILSVRYASRYVSDLIDMLESNDQMQVSFVNDVLKKMGELIGFDISSVEGLGQMLGQNLSGWMTTVEGFKGILELPAISTAEKSCLELESEKRSDIVLGDLFEEDDQGLTLAVVDNMRYAADSVMNFAGNLITLLYLVNLKREKYGIVCEDVSGLSVRATSMTFLKLLSKLDKQLSPKIRTAHSMLTGLAPLPELWVDGEEGLEMMSLIYLRFIEKSRGKQIITPADLVASDDIHSLQTIEAASTLLSQVYRVLASPGAFDADGDNMVFANTMGLSNVLRFMFLAEINVETQGSVDAEEAKLIVTLFANYLKALVDRSSKIRLESDAINLTDVMAGLNELCREMEEAEYPLLEIVDSILLQWGMPIPVEQIETPETLEYVVGMRQRINVLRRHPDLRELISDLMEGVDHAVISRVRSALNKSIEKKIAEKRPT